MMKGPLLIVCATHASALRRSRRVIFLATLLLPLLALGAEAPDCSAKLRKQVRAEAKKLHRQKNFAAEVALLSPLVPGCPLEEEQDFWILNDLAVALLRNGQVLECQRLVAPALSLGPGVRNIAEAGLEESEVADALEQTLGTCNQTQEVRRAALVADPCPFPLDLKPAALIAAPPTLLPKGATRGCLVLTKPSRRVAGEVLDVDAVCPKLLLAVEDATGAREMRQLEPKRGEAKNPLVDVERCCNMRTLRAGYIDGKTVFLLGGRGRECAGPGAIEELAVFYEWTDQGEVQLLLDASVGLR